MLNTAENCNALLLKEISVMGVIGENNKVKKMMLSKSVRGHGGIPMHSNMMVVIQFVQTPFFGKIDSPLKRSRNLYKDWQSRAECQHIKMPDVFLILYITLN